MHVAPEESPRLAPISVLLILLTIGLAVSVDQLDNETIGNDVKIANWSQLFGVIAGSALAIVLPLLRREETEPDPATESA